MKKQNRFRLVEDRQALPDAEVVHRSSAGLRDALFEELDALRQGQIGISHANAVARLAFDILLTIKLELDNRALDGREPRAVTFARSDDLHAD